MPELMPQGLRCSPTLACDSIISLVDTTVLDRASRDSAFTL